MILGYTNEEIVKKAVEYQSQISDGVAQYNYETGELFGAGFTTGEIENPANPVIEIFRLSQGERGEIDCNCNECPYRDEDAQYPGWETLYPETDEECCIDAYTDIDFHDDWEANWRECVEMQVRDVLKNYLGGTLSKLNDLRCELTYIIKGTGAYQQALQDNWEENVLDTYVDCAIDDGFTTEEDPLTYLDAEYEYLKNIARYAEAGTMEEELLLGKVAGCMMNNDLDGALQMLQ